eukprot:TRINITY_DN3_c0_g1_i2.p1 TRINITY_DN3_c0_g1~~TRINITY_DN3_c0_g1_i2.p1  ORF type:complete len:217 (+),score=97.35 TRINITY_DN3_c0_g1_i2:773-1423(+)
MMLRAELTAMRRERDEARARAERAEAAAAAPAADTADDADSLADALLASLSTGSRDSGSKGARLPSAAELSSMATESAAAAKASVFSEAQRSAADAAIKLVRATIADNELGEFVAAVKAAAADMMRPLQLAEQIFEQASVVPVHANEAIRDNDALGCYRRTLFELISDAKRVRTQALTESAAERSVLDERCHAVHDALFWFNLFVEQIIFTKLLVN